MVDYVIKITLALSFLAATTSYAGAFNTLNYSGRLVHLDGSPKEGVVDLEIKFFDSELEGSQKGSTYPFSSISIKNGVFSLEIVLSDVDISAALDPTSATWIEITDVTDLVTYPRQKLNAVPYAIKAGSVDNASTSATSSNTGEAIVLRDFNGNFEVSEPLSSSHVTTKSYVDAQVSSSYGGAISYIDTQVSSSNGLPINHIPIRRLPHRILPINHTPIRRLPHRILPINHTPIRRLPHPIRPINHTPIRRLPHRILPINHTPIRRLPHRILPINHTPIRRLL